MKGFNKKEGITVMPIQWKQMTREQVERITNGKTLDETIQEWNKKYFNKRPEAELQDLHAKEYHGLDDDMPDAYDKWLCEMIESFNESNGEINDSILLEEIENPSKRSWLYEQFIEHIKE